ncbi:ABC transporter substrate-binding protein [Variovorax sp. M-6]|uniref:ABC transporter substrate-binding protein n=1 Tax=Variovorax sp. M-6 TaxID=3233041 RepID=UPI003F9942E8
MKTGSKLLAVAMSSLTALSFAGSAYAQYTGDTIKVGLITDLSGLYTDIDGPGGAEAVKMAIEDMGGSINGKKIEFQVADHQNKADIAATTARAWFDSGLDMLIGGANSSAGLATAKLAADKKRVFMAVGTGSARLTNEECTPYAVHYAYDTVALARGTGGAMTRQGGKSWFFLTADFAFGTSLEKDTADVVKINGGTVIGEARHPLSASDFSSFIMQAQASKAQVLGLANAGPDTINAIKASSEFGVSKTMKMAGLMLFVNDVHSLGLKTTQGMYLTDGWYWDANEQTRAWSKRFFAKMKRMPTMVQAGDYSATLTYLKAVKATGTDDADKVMAYLKANKINDMFTQNGVIRPDGRMVHDMYLMQVKTPAESRYPWDYYKLIETIPGDKAFMSKAESKCALWK